MLITASAAKCRCNKFTIASTAGGLVGGLHDGVCDLMPTGAARQGIGDLSTARSGRDLSLHSVERYAVLAPPLVHRQANFEPLSAGDPAFGPAQSALGSYAVGGRLTLVGVDDSNPAAKRPRKAAPSATLRHPGHLTGPAGRVGHHQGCIRCRRLPPRCAPPAPLLDGWRTTSPTPRRRPAANAASQVHTVEHGPAIGLMERVRSPRI